MEYTVLYLDGNMPDLSGRIVDPDIVFRGITYIPIMNYPWAADEGNYTPEARAYAFFNEKGIHVAMFAKELTISAKETRFCGDVYMDSCLEAFISPKPEDCSDYINVEMNCIATVHIGIGSGRNDRRHPSVMPQGMNPVATGHNGSWWGISFTLPVDFLREEFNIDKLDENTTMRGNFFACDKTLHIHHGTWQNISTPQPSYHRPEDFGFLRFLSKSVSFDKWPD